MNKEQWKEKIAKEGIDDLVIEYAPEWSAWGSCQYQTAAGFCRLVRALHADLDWPDTCAVLGLHCSHKGLNKNYLQEVQQALDAEQKDREEDDYEYWSQHRPEPVTDITNAFETLRSLMDLWGAAPLVAYACFQDLCLETPASPGFGPPLNIVVQSENYKVGLCCALLQIYGLVEDEEPFKDFDT